MSPGDSREEDRVTTFRVDDTEAGKRLDRLLADRFPEVSRERWQRAIAEGRVKTAKKKVVASYRPSHGETITCHVPEARTMRPPEPESIPLNILYEDEWLAAIDKPAGLVVHPAQGHRTGTLVNAILHRYKKQLADDKDPVRPGIVHRLDRDTSGVVLVVFDTGVQQAMRRLFQRHDVERLYDAVVWGDFNTPRAVIDVPIARSGADRKKMVVREDGKPSKTLVEAVEGNGKITHVRCQLVTGRTHQIRVHLAHIGYPVIGDPLYGNPGKDGNLRKMFNLRANAGQEAGGSMRAGVDTRTVGGATVDDPFNAGNRRADMNTERVDHPFYQLLHASRLSFVHPVTGELLSIESPLAERFKPFIDDIRASSRDRA